MVVPDSRADDIFTFPKLENLVMPSDSVHHESSYHNVPATSPSAPRPDKPDIVTSPTLNLKQNRPTRKPPSTLAVPLQCFTSARIPSIQLESSDSPIFYCNGSDHRLSDSSCDSESTTPEYPCQQNSVTLPGRYRAKLAGSCDSLASPDRPVTSPASDGEIGQDDMSSREEDLSTALRWIRQEILLMKEQDKSLQRQFIELRTSILQLRCVYAIQGSYSDISSLEGSTYSLNEPIKSPKMQHLVLEGDRFLNKLSISLPSSPIVERFKWRNDDYM
ncbi:unnamed protein product [Lymnaea stagnalis]|uniref:Uncharacterized protein n=1 Tax=Lymnaea stagnalis TaxID=6523 RepID=A0AAV2HCS8_LYMST